MSPIKKGVKKILRGAAIEYLKYNFSLTPGQHTDCKIGHVLFIYIQHGQSTTQTVKQINEIYYTQPTIGYITSTVNKCKNWACHFSRYADRVRFEEYCNRLFVCPTLSHLSTQSFTPFESTTQTIYSETHYSETQSSKSATLSSPEKDLETKEKYLKPSRDILTPQRIKLKRRLSIISSNSASASKKLKNRITVMISKLNDLPHETKVLKQKIKRRDTTIKRLREEIASLKKNSKVVDLGIQFHHVKSVFEKKMKTMKSIHTLAMLEKQSIIASLENCLVEAQNEKTQNDIVIKKNKKEFNSTIRPVIYRCLECNVPVDSVSTVIAACTNLISDSKILPIDLPTASTVAQMSREMGVISELQAADAILKAECVTLAFDSTTIKGSHVNEIHVATKDQQLTLSIRELPGGTADDYVAHIVSVFDDISHTHSKLSKADKNEIKLKMYGKIMCTLTDRASVNHAAVGKLNILLEKLLLELKCHLHPVDGIASQTRKNLLKLNPTITSSTYGSDCRAANLLYSISKLRYKAKGDPTGFKSFMKKNGLSCSTFPRYVGNRLHVLFCSSGIVFRHRQLLIEYLSKYCNSTTPLRTSVLEDLKNDKLMIQIQALGLWGKLFTGPWMAVVYAEEDRRNHLDMVKYFQSAVAFTERVVAEPDFVLTTNEDAFGRPLLIDDTLACLVILDTDSVDLLNSVLTTIAIATLDVLKRQLEPYLEGCLANPTDLMKDQADCAPWHNMWAERALGIVDALSHKAPNAEISFIDGKTKAKLNKSLDWLCAKSPQEQHSIVKYAINRAAVNRRDSKIRRLSTEDIIHKRLQEKGQKREMGHRNKISKEIKKLFLEKSSLFDNPIFASLTEDVKSKVLHLLDKDHDHLVGVRIQHVWNLKGIDVIFNGKFVMKAKLSKGKPRAFLIAYWRENETEDDAEDSKITLENLLTDIALGDLLFC